MHQSRRRKKRPNYGIRTIEVARGNCGFGFTISGQAPCILSCIVNGSPADRAGLRPGDYLIAVNGLNVFKMAHDDVVQLIGQTYGILMIQISENIFYSDSSEDEFISANRHKPKYPNRARHKQSSGVRAEKVVQDVQSGALFTKQFFQDIRDFGQEVKVAGDDLEGVNKSLIDIMLQKRMHEVITASCANIDSSVSHAMTKGRPNGPPRAASEDSCDSSNPDKFRSSVNFTKQELNNILYPSLQKARQGGASNFHSVANFRSIVGYLGTIEMPKEPQVHVSRLQAIRSCIRRLRIEKKIHTLVLLSVYSHQVLLTNPHGLTLAEYPAEKIAFSGAYADDKKFFGLVTGQGMIPDDVSEESQPDCIPTSSSCHVFMVDARIQPHYKHTKRARAFRIECTIDADSNQCQEFPGSAEPILRAISALYRGQQIIGAPGLVNVDGNLSPQRSNTSSNSSNSDSGIGFRDEAGSHNSDQMFIVDLLDHTLNGHRRNYPQGDDNRMPSRAMRNVANLSTSDSSLHQIGRTPINFNTRSHRTTPTAGLLSSPLTIGATSSTSPNRLTVRAMPDPVGYVQSPPKSQLNEYTNLIGALNQSIKSCQPLKSPIDDLMNVRALGDPPKKCVRRDSSELLSYNAQYSSARDSKTPVPSPLNLISYKLSPKVYGVVPNVCNIVDRNSSNDCSGPQRIVGVSSDESWGDGRRHDDHWSSATSQYSENIDSEIEAGVRGSKIWTNVAYLKKLAAKQIGPGTSRSELGTVSDGELATSVGCSSAKPTSSSATSSMIGLDRISSTDIETTSTQVVDCNPETMSSQSSSIADNERPIDVGRVASWGANFENLLDDPAGMHTFSEFLKSEFSQENILFWVASERFKCLKDNLQIKTRAKEIYERHLGLGASEPVNVDSHARQLVQDNLDNPTTELFNLAQKQIYDLMKFDCYSRFLKCQLYKDSVVQEMSGLPLVHQGDYTLNANITWEQLDQIERDKSSKTPKSKDDSCGEEKRKKSLIPWHRGKGKDSKLAKELDARRSWRRKKKDGNKENKWSGSVRDDISVPSSDLTGSRTSLASIDLDHIQRHAISHESLTSSEFMAEESLKKDETDFCRIILPDHSSTVLQVRNSETIKDVVQRLTDRNTLNFSAVDVYPIQSEKPLDQNKLISSFKSKEFRIEQRIIFRIDLPNKKTIGVKSKATKNVVDIMKPILQKYGFKIDNVVVHVDGADTKLNLTSSITLLDNKRIIVKTLNDFAECGYDSITPRHSLPNKNSKNSGSLNEITNRVFEDLLKGKSQAQFDELGVFDLDQKSNIFDDQTSSISDTRSSSSHQSGLLNLVRRSSFHVDNSKNRLSHKVKLNLLDLGNVKQAGNESVANLRAINDKMQPPKIRPKINPTRLSDNEAITEMFEVWKRAQKSRLEDQRGTEINGELPEFLKQKSNDKNNYLEGESMYSHSRSRSYSDAQLDDVIDLSNTSPIICYDFLKDSIIPSHQEAENYFSGNSIGFDNANFSKKLSLREEFLTPAPPRHRRAGRSTCSLDTKAKQPIKRPVSQPVFGSETCRYLESLVVRPIEDDLDKTLECARELDLDPVDDLDITLKGAGIDESFSPSLVPPPDDLDQSSIHLEVANFSPPRLNVHHLASPPPLPPKPAMRGPPPRPPSRPLSEPTNQLSPVQQTKLDLIKQSCRSRKPLYVDKDGADRLNISFV